MARARNIKPKFFENEDLAELDPLARLLFIGLWTIADFKGCLEYRWKRIKVQILPYDDCDITELANSLDKSGFISIYSVQGQQYIKILKFQAHQTPHKNEREAGSAIPDISEKHSGINELTKDEINPDKNGTARADSLFPLPDSLFIDSAPEPVAPAEPKKRKAPNIPLPNDFGISERVRNWAKEKGYSNLEAHLENFIGACKAKGYTYADWDEGFMGAVRRDWAKLGVAPASQSDKPWER